MLLSSPCRYLLPIALSLGVWGWLWLRPAIASSPTPGTKIENQATGSYVDDADNSTQTILSDKVTLTVAEVAGITISNPSISEPSAATIGATAAPFQGIAGVNQDDILYFDFVITNAGNDPTQFFIPGAPLEVLNGSFDRVQYGAVQIIEVKDGAGVVVALPGGATKIDIPATGANTGDAGMLGTTDGSIAAGGSVKVRIPIKVTGTSGQSVKVTLGDTGANDNSAGTSNQTYSASTTTGADVKTTDNDDTVSGETSGAPVNGEKEASRYGEIGIVATPQVVGFKSVKFTDGLNQDGKLNPGETLTWRIAYVNTGTLDVPNFQLTDLLPTGVTKTGATLTVGNGQTAPTVNPSYTGTNTTPGTTDTLFVSPITFKAGGVITTTISATVNSGIQGILSNQAVATADNLPLAGISTDNAGKTADLPPTIAAAPYSITIPSGSATQTLTATIDPTTIDVSINPHLAIVKRITAINGNTSFNPNDPTKRFDEFVDDETSNDNNCLWAGAVENPIGSGICTTPYLKGATSAGIVKSGDEIEYTIYFLNAGVGNAQKVRICDRLTNTDQSFISGSYAPYKGIQLVIGGTTTTNLTDSLADTDGGQYIPGGSPVALTGCNLQGSNDAGTVVVDVTGDPLSTTPTVLSGSTVAGTSNAYGYFRFKTRMK
jgi:uncharacterized repeat protein (TIGR01451 family)